MAIPPVQRHIIQFERQPAEPPTNFDKVKEIAGKILAILGLTLLLATAAAFSGALFGCLVIEAELLHTIFMTGIVSTIAGFHLAKSDSPATEFSAGPLAISI